MPPQTQHPLHVFLDITRWEKVWLDLALNVVQTMLVHSPTKLPTHAQLATSQKRAKPLAPSSMRLVLLPAMRVVVVPVSTLIPMRTYA